MKITKQQLLERIELIEGWMDGADEMLTELNHALPDPEYDAKCEADESAISVSLDRHRERLGLNKPQLKQLDQSVFDGAYKIWRFASVDADGAGFRFAERPELTDCFWRNVNRSRFDRLSQSGTYDTSNWQNSLIERDIAIELLEVDLSSELTGSDLCRAMLARGDKYILCLVGDGGDYRVANQGYAFIVTGVHSNGEFDTPVYTWEFAVPINNQGESLTASEVGL